MNELFFPMIPLPDGSFAYGGSQDWFPEQRQQYAGCASVAAANIAAYYGIPSTPNSQSEFLAMMSELYLRMTPGVAGYPYALKFGKSFSIYAKDFGEELHPVYSGRVRSAEHGTSFVRSSIENDSPVAVLILFHKAKELDDDTWHWITLFGHSGDTLIASNYGKKVLYRASVLFGRSFRNLVRMVSFRRSPQ